jgi:hypothetical protein
MHFSPPQDEPRRYSAHRERDNPRTDGERDFHAASSPGGRVIRQRRQVGESLAQVDALGRWDSFKALA